MATTTMIKPCDICGDPGVTEAIITCCECKVSREHMYCMRVVRTQAPPFWRCEECDRKKMVTPKLTFKEQKTQKLSNVIQENRVASNLKFKEKKVDKGRTKYLSCDEAVKLSSGSITLNNSPRLSQAVSPTRVSQQSTGLKEKPAPSRRVERTNPEREMNTKKNELQPSRKETNISSNTVVKILDNTETKSGCKNDADVEADAGKPNPTSGLVVSEMHDPYIPSLNSYWKGCFYLPNGPLKSHDAFKAHPASRIHYKAYETMKKMPENIYFELVPNNEILMEIFPAGNGPDRDDIGLYFFPAFKIRSENDVSITDFISRENLVMKSNVEEVELLVLSSRVLPSHSQEFEGKCFLWGVFRRAKAMKIASESRLPVEAKGEPEPTCDDAPPGFEKILKKL